MTVKQWYSATDLAGLPGLPTTSRGVTLKAQREDWPSRPRKGQGGGREYRVIAVPAATLIALLAGEDHE
jgi:putative transposase